MCANTNTHIDKYKYIYVCKYIYKHMCKYKWEKGSGHDLFFPGVRHVAPLYRPPPYNTPIICIASTVHCAVIHAVCAECFFGGWGWGGGWSTFG